MKYKELFLINHVYVVHPHKRKPIKLCPREEVAHPERLDDIVFRNSRNWRDINIDGTIMRYLRGEHDKQFYENIASSHFYVLTDVASTSIFLDAQRVSRNSIDEMVCFLLKHHSTNFLVTAPVFVMETYRRIPNIHFSIPVSDVHVPIYLPLGNTIEVRDMINTRCYTVCNGITLFLAMVRINRWTPGIARSAFEIWQRSCTDVHPADLQGVWQDLYTAHPIPMIADFPNYYATMYPPVPVSFLPCLNSEDTVPLSQFVEQNVEDEDDTTSFYASPLTSMYPYFNQDIFDYYNPNFANTDTVQPVFQAPFDIEDDDIQFVDIEGFLIGILRSRRAWKWWKRFGPTYIKKAFHANNGSYGFLMYIFQVLFDLYELPYISIRYTRSKVRSIWISILDMIDIPPYDIKMFVNIILVKSIIYKHFNINRWNPNIPIPFMVDVMRRYQNNMDWYKVSRNKVYTISTYDINEILAIFSPYMRIHNENSNEYTLVCSFYQLLKMDEKGAIFVKRVLDRHVAKKLLCIERIFGMKNDMSPIADVTEHDGYAIGNIVMDYLKDNRGDII